MRSLILMTALASCTTPKAADSGANATPAGTTPPSTGTGVGTPSGVTTAPADADGDGYSSASGDCDDTDPAVSPDAAELCGDAVDQDCDGHDRRCPQSLAFSDGMYVGSAAGEQAGWSVAAADLDSDGTVEVVIGATGADVPSINSGRIYVDPLVTGMSFLSSARTTLTGSDGTNAGFSAAITPDQTGDGVNDILVGGSNVAWVVSGQAAPGDIGSAAAATLAYIEAFGWDVASAGTSAGGGASLAVLIGAPGSGLGGPSSGAAFLFIGPLSGGVDVGAEGIPLIGDNDGDGAGSAVGNAGDTNGDGLDDVFVGAENASYSASEAGAVYLVEGPITNTVLLSGANRLTGEGANDTVGRRDTVAGAGDTNGDGYADVLVSAPESDAHVTNGGVAYLIEGPLATGSTSLADVTTTFWGDTDSQFTGSGVAAGEDFDGDGVLDIAVGAPGDASAGFETGAAFVFLGPFGGSTPSGTAHLTFLGEEGGHMAGAPLRLVPDVSGDGRAELLVGTTGADAYGSRTGAVYLLLGLRP